MSMSGRSALFRWIDAASGFQRVVEGLASQGLSPTQSGGSSRCARCPWQGCRGRGILMTSPSHSTTSLSKGPGRSLKRSKPRFDASVASFYSRKKEPRSAIYESGSQLFWTKFSSSPCSRSRRFLFFFFESGLLFLTSFSFSCVGDLVIVLEASGTETQTTSWSTQ